MTSSKRARRSLMLGLILALGGALVGCGGGSAPMSAKSAEPPAAMGYQQPGQPQAMPIAPGGAAGDSAGPSPAPPASPPESSAQREAPKADARPGLGTEWGETRQSKITTVPFHRADSS